MIYLNKWIHYINSEYMVDNSKYIRSLISGLISNNDIKVDQITKQLVESIIVSKKDVITETLRKKIQGEL